MNYCKREDLTFSFCIVWIHKEGACVGERGGGLVGRWDHVPETLYHRDDALLYIAFVMLIWAAPIPTDRWHCSLYNRHLEEIHFGLAMN